MINRLISKILRELYLLLHPALWGKKVQLNGIPRIYSINNLKIGKNVSINQDCVLQCYGEIEIEDNVTISDGAKILTRKLKTEEYIINASKAIREHEDKKVKIKKGTWLAANVLVLPGVEIASNCIIAAGAVVSKSITEESALYGGVPAHLIKKLD